MVLGKLIGKKSVLGAAATFQSFDDLSVGQSTHDSDADRCDEGLGNRALRHRSSLLRAPSFEKVRYSATEEDENVADELYSESDCSDESSTWSSYGVDGFPEQFHMSSACTVNAPAQFVVPNTLGNGEGTLALGHIDDYDNGSESHSSTSYTSDPNETQSVESDEVDCIKGCTKKRADRGKDLQATPKRRHCSATRLKRRTEERLKTRIDSSPQKNAMNNIEEKIPKTDNCSGGENSEVLDASGKKPVTTTACISPCPRSPAKTLRGFKRTNATTSKVTDLHASTVQNDSFPHTPGTRPLRPLAEGITCPKTNGQLPMLNPLDSSLPSATPIQYSVDLNRQTPVRHRQKYVLGETMNKSVLSVDMVGSVIDRTPQTKGSRRGSLQHVPRPHMAPHPRRLSCPMNAGAAEDNGDLDEDDDAFTRVIGLIDSHTRETASFESSGVLSTPARKKKSTVDELKKKIQKDREKLEGRKKQTCVEQTRCSGGKRLHSPRRSMKGHGHRICRRQLVSTIAFDPTN